MNADNERPDDGTAADPFTRMVEAFIADREDLALVLHRAAHDSGQRHTLTQVAELLGIDLDRPAPDVEQEPPALIYTDSQIRDLLAALGWGGEIELTVSELDDITLVVDAARELGLLPGVEVEIPDIWHGTVDLRLDLGLTKSRTLVELDVDGYLGRDDVREPGDSVAKVRHLLTYLAGVVITALAEFADHFVPARSQP